MAATAIIWASATVATYVAVIRWAATIDDNTLATVHPITPVVPNIESEFHVVHP